MAKALLLFSAIRVYGTHLYQTGSPPTVLNTSFGVSANIGKVVPCPGGRELLNVWSGGFAPSRE